MTNKLNPFVYEECLSSAVKFPDIPVLLNEHYAQCAEDVIVLSILQAIESRFQIELEKQRYLEIGGNHPIATSSTFLLQKRLGMRGVIVEANPDLIDDLRRVRAHDTVVHAAVTAHAVDSVKLSVSNASEISSLDREFVHRWQGGEVGERAYINVPARRINDIIAQELDGIAPVYLSVDIEGLDLDVLRDLDFAEYRPAVIQAEPSDYYLPGNTARMTEFMSSVGYDLSSRTRVNLIYVDRLIEESEQKRRRPV